MGIKRGNTKLYNQHIITKLMRNGQSSLTHNSNARFFSLAGLDFLAEGFKLRLPTLTGRHQTSVGGLLTVVLGLMVTLSSIAIFSQYMTTEAPIVTTSTEFGSNSTEYDLYNEQLFTPITVLNRGVRIPAKKAARYITPVLHIEESLFSDFLGEADLKVSTSIYLVPCDTINDKMSSEILNRSQSQLSNPALQPALCPDFKDGLEKKLRAGTNQTTRSTLRTRLVIYPCSLQDQTKCASTEELSNAKVLYYKTEKVLNSSNRLNPVSLSTKTKAIRVDHQIKKVKEFEVRSSRIKDDTHLFGETELKEDYATLHETNSDFRMRAQDQHHCSKEEILKGEAGGCQEYAVFNYLASREVLNIRRSYPKLTSVLGEIGGFFKLVSAVVFFFIRFTMDGE